MEVKLNCLRSKMTQRQMICTKLGTEKKKVKNEYIHLIKMLKLSSVCRHFIADITLQPSELPTVYKLTQSFSFI